MRKMPVRIATYAQNFEGFDSMFFPFRALIVVF